MGSGDQKRFSKLIVSTLNAINNYFKLEENVVGETSSMSEVELKEISDAFNGLKSVCRESDCQDILLETVRNMQEFGRSNWIQLQSFIRDTRQGTSRSRTDMDESVQHREIEGLKAEMDEKERMIKTLLKDNNSIKN